MASLGDLRWRRTAHSAATPHTAAALDILRHPQWRQDESLPDLALVPGDTRYLLFFDGGSRGNPGPGGSGAVIARITDEATHATVVYTAAMSHAARTTTNNQAEYRGLVTGLTTATQFQWTPLEVVGDSMLIIQQMKRYKAPQNRRLQRSYAVARRLADILGVRTWKHHPQAANRMADAAAILAMDEERSSQVLHPTHRPEHKQIAALLSSDIAHYRIGLQS